MLSIARKPAMRLSLPFAALLTVVGMCSQARSQDPGNSVLPTSAAPFETPPLPRTAHAMRFNLVNSGGGMHPPSWVAAEGIITSDTPRVFTDFVNSLGDAGNMTEVAIIFNSPGGDFKAAMVLGRVIRDTTTRMWTSVGATDTVSDGGDTPSYEVSGGECIDACVLAYLGARTRSISVDSAEGRMRLGFYTYNTGRPESILDDVPPDAAGLPLTILLDGALAAYAEEMGADRRLFRPAADHEGNERIFTQTEANDFGLNSPPRPKTTWTLVPLQGGLALRGVGRFNWSSYAVTMRCDPARPDHLSYELSVPIPSWWSPDMAEHDTEGDLKNITVVNQSGNRSVATSLPLRIAGTTMLAGATFDSGQVAILGRNDAMISFNPSAMTRIIFPGLDFDPPQAADTLALLLRTCPQP